jgi:hypothetical protein
MRRRPESRLQPLHDEQERTRKNEAGRDLIRAIFGKDGVGKDPVR